jgi:hypothetical protein
MRGGNIGEQTPLEFQRDINAELAASDTIRQKADQPWFPWLGPRKNPLSSNPDDARVQEMKRATMVPYAPARSTATGGRRRNRGRKQKKSRRNRNRN